MDNRPSPATYAVRAFVSALMLVMLSTRATARARLWPERLGAGEPYAAETRLEDYIEAGLLRRTGDGKRSGELLRRIVAYTGLQGASSGMGQLLGACALRDLGKSSEALRILGRWIKREPENPRTRWSLLAYRKDRSGAEALEASLRSTLLNRSNGDQEFVLMTDVAREGFGK